MLPMHLQHGRQYCLGYCSDMRTEVAGNIDHSSLYRQYACKVRLEFNFTGMPVVKLCAVVAQIVGGACSHSSEK